MNTSEIKKRPQISIIVAIYNSQDYIERCLRSLMEQTLADIEYIFVDDHSQDDSLRILNHICEQYPTRQSQITIITHTFNKGVSLSRQDGVDVAQGEYIIHCDPDDWFNTEAMSKMYSEAKKTNCDMLIMDYYSETETNSSRVIQLPNSLIPNDIIKQFFSNLHGSLCNKLIRNDYIKEKKVRFNPSLSFCEDLCYNIELLNKNPIVSYLNEAFYHYLYNQNQNSLTRKYSIDVYNGDQNLLTYLISIVPQRIKLNAYNNMSWILTWRAFISGYFKSKEYRAKFQKYIFPLLKSNASIKIKLLLIISLCGNYNLARNLYLRFKN